MKKFFCYCCKTIRIIIGVCLLLTVGFFGLEIGLEIGKYNIFLGLFFCMLFSPIGIWFFGFIGRKIDKEYFEKIDNEV